MPLMDGTSHNLPGEGNPSSIAPCKSIHINISKKLMTKYEFYSRKDGHKMMSEALRAGIKSYNGDSLELRTDMDEKTKIKEIFDRMDMDLKDTYNIKISLEEDQLQKFDKLILQKGLSRNRAIKEIVYAQILDWKKKYDSTQKKEENQKNEKPIKNAHVIEGEKKLKAHLEMLKRFSLINIPELTVVWQPKNNYHLHGEVIGKTIFIYDMTFEEAMTTLEHEYLHKFCKIVSNPAIEGANTIIILMNMLVRHLNREIYEQQEKIIDKFVGRMRKKQATS
jgi:metal-responsive CopG/Arc/MetJ family transcriptional regulator